MGSHLSHKNLKRSRKIIGTPEVGLFPGNIRLVFRVYKVAVSIGLLRVVAYDRSRVRFLQSFDHRTSYLRRRRSRHIDDQPTEINVKKETRRLLRKSSALTQESHECFILLQQNRICKDSYWCGNSL